MMTGPDNLGSVRASMQRLTSAAEAVLVPGERLATTGIGWAAQLRPRVPVLFLGRRQHWFALTDRRVLVFSRHRGGPGPADLVLAKRYSFFTLEKVHRHRPLFQIRIRGANDSRLVLEFRPGQRSVAAELVARLTRALPPARSEPTAAAHATMPGDARPPAPPSDAEPDVDRDTATAFWGEH
jgi:hypothetical protein